jgi:primosomal protein N''
VRSCSSSSLTTESVPNIEQRAARCRAAMIKLSAAG